MMSEHVTNPNDKKFDDILMIKMDNGDDLLGPNMGLDDNGMLAVMRPLKVHTRTQVTENGTGVLRVPELYSPYSKNSVVLLDGKNIMMISPASKFYARFYWFTLGNLIAHEEQYQKYMTDVFDQSDMEKSVEGIDSVHLHETTGGIQ